MEVKIQLLELSIAKFEITDYGNNNKQVELDKYEFQFTQDLRISEVDFNISSRFTVNLFEKIDEYSKEQLAELVIVNIIKVVNFSDSIKKDGTEVLIPDQLIHVINNLIVNHARGILVAKLQNSAYSNALMPLINPMILAPKESRKLPLPPASSPT